MGGSSPRAWGALIVRRDRLAINRFIPTCVGSMAGSALAASQARFIPTCVGSIEQEHPRP